MNATLVLRILGELYSVALRDLLIRAVEDPDEQWDDFLLGIFDTLFGFDGHEVKAKK